MTCILHFVLFDEGKDDVLYVEALINFRKVLVNKKYTSKPVSYWKPKVKSVLPANCCKISTNRPKTKAATCAILFIRPRFLLLLIPRSEPSSSRSAQRNGLRHGL